MNNSKTANNYPAFLRFIGQLGRDAHNIFTAKLRHQKMLKERKSHFGQQLQNLRFVAFCIVGIFIANYIWTDFYVFPYLKWSISFDVVSGFWPLYVWCFILWGSLNFVGKEIYSSELDEQLLKWGLITGNTASLWEESGFRYAFICFTMLFLMFLNFVLGTFVIWILAALCAFVAFANFIDEDAPAGNALFMAVLTISLVFMADLANPIYWLYEYVTIPILNLVSLGSFSEIISSGQHDPLFIMGAILANARFRDGHKYQGPVGHMHSWFLGFIFIYATMTYGLFTAMVLHGLWNTQLYLMTYLRRKAVG